jgi:hypothetical protein
LAIFIGKKMEKIVHIQETMFKKKSKKLKKKEFIPNE